MKIMIKFSIAFLAGLMVANQQQVISGQEPTGPTRARFDPGVRVQPNRAEFAVEPQLVPKPGRQGRTQIAPDVSPNPNYDPGIPGFENNPFGPTARSFNRQQSKLQSEINAKLREYKETKEDSKKNDLQEEIRKLLNQQFDERLEEPQQRVKQSRKRLDDLKSQIKSRLDKANEIIDLRLKVLIHEATGLGWGHGHSQWRTASSGLYGFPAMPSAPGIDALSMPAGASQQLAAPKGMNSGRRSGPGNLMPSNQWPLNQSRPKHPAPYSSGRNGVKPSGLTGGHNKKNDQPSVHQLLRDYKAADKDSERKKIEKELRSLLGQEFKQYQDQLSQSAKRIEHQITKLEENMAERKDEKSSIVDLKLKTVINQVNGLSF